MPAKPLRIVRKHLNPRREATSPGHPAFGRLSREELRRIVADLIG